MRSTKRPELTQVPSPPSHVQACPRIRRTHEDPCICKPSVTSSNIVAEDVLTLHAWRVRGRASMAQTVRSEVKMDRIRGGLRVYYRSGTQVRISRDGFEVHDLSAAH